MSVQCLSAFRGDLCAPYIIPSNKNYKVKFLAACAFPEYDRRPAGISFNGLWWVVEIRSTFIGRPN